MSVKASFSSDNTLAAIGNYRIISFSDPFYDVRSITNYTDTVSNELTEAVAQRSMRWSKDGDSWSMWIDFAISDKTPITSLAFDPDKPLYLDFKYTLYCPDDVSPGLEAGDTVSPAITITGLELFFDLKVADVGSGDFKRITRCSDEFCTMPVILRDKFTFDPYAVNKALCLYKDLSKMVNNMFGHEVFYWRVSPQQRSQDIVFKEWTLFNVAPHRCVKVMVPNNEFPDSKPNFNEFNIDFEVPFEIHVDKIYFESFFGKNIMPQSRDIVYFPMINRVYEVASSYLYRDFMQQGIYYKVALVKYQPKADTLMPDDVAQNLDDLTISTEELFGEAMEENIKRITKPQQYQTITHETDPIRSLINRRLPTIRYDLYNNYTALCEYFYDLNSLYNYENGTVTVAVQYRPTVTFAATESRSYACWFQPQRDTKNSTNNVRNLLKGSGFSLDLYYDKTGSSSRIDLTVGSWSHQFALNVPLSDETWYGLVVNFSNEFSQAGVYLWVMQEGTTDLILKKKVVSAFTPTVLDSATTWYLNSSPLYLTFIRLFDAMVEEEHMSLLLNQMIVKDSHMAIVIDNSRPVMRLPRIANPK